MKEQICPWCEKWPLQINFICEDSGGIGGATGFSGAEADGFVFDGEVGGNVSTIGGGFSETNAYRFTPGIGDVGIGAGSVTQTSAITGADVAVNVDPDNGFGEADGRISGFTAMGSLNGSIVGPSPRRDWDTDGYSAGVAGQGAVGGFEGGVVAGSGPDYYWYYPVDSYAGAAAGANIEMTGFSQSESYRYIDNNDDGFHTEGMGTFVDAGTQVSATGYNTNYRGGLGFSGSGVHGGYKAVGGAATRTVQSNSNGGANATAIGIYAGSGSLNTAFEGRATGYSNTSMTTHPTTNGVVSQSSAGMQVTSKTTGNPDTY